MNVRERAASKDMVGREWERVSEWDHLPADPSKSVATGIFGAFRLVFVINLLHGDSE